MSSHDEQSANAFVDYSEVSEALRYAWGGQYEEAALGSTLRRFEQALQNPAEAPPSDASRQRVSSELKQRAPPYRHLPERVIVEVSELLHVDEWLCYELLLNCGGSNTLDGLRREMVQVFLRRRINLYNALQDLFLFYDHDDCPGRIDAFVADLIEGGLVHNLCVLVDTLAKQRIKTPELQRVVMLLLYLARNRRHPLCDTDLLEILDAVKRQEAHQRDGGDVSAQWVLVCAFMAGVDSMCESLETAAPDAPRRLVRFIEEGNKTLDSRWHPSSSSSPQQNECMKSFVMLVWTVFIRGVQAMAENVDHELVKHQSRLALQSGPRGVFTFLEETMLRSAWFASLEPGQQLILCEPLGDFMAAMIGLDGLVHVRELWDDYNDAGSPAPQGNFPSLLASLALVSKHCVDLADGFWQVLHLEECLRLVDDLVQLTSPLLEPFVDLLEAVCGTEDGAAHVSVLLDRSRNLNTGRILQNLEWVAQGGLASISSDKEKKRVLSMVSCQLRLLTAIVNAPATRDALFCGQGDALTMDVLFALLGVAFPTHVKAAVIHTIAAFARDNAEMAVAIWARLDNSQILPDKGLIAVQERQRLQQQQQQDEEEKRRRGAFFGFDNKSDTNSSAVMASKKKKKGASLQGIVHDLEMIEKPEQRYPLTVAFVELIVELVFAVRDSQLPLLRGPAQGMQLSVVPYMAFVRERVFLSISHRQYRDPLERWRLAEASLNLFFVLLNELDVHEQPHHEPQAQNSPSFSVMHLLCSNDTFFGTVLDVFYDGFCFLEAGDADATAALVDYDAKQPTAQQQQRPPSSSSSSSSDGERAAALATMMLAAKLLSTAMDAEETFIANLRARPHAAYGASTDYVSRRLLRSDQRFIAALGKSVGLKAIDVGLEGDTRSDTHDELCYHAARIMLRLSQVDAALLVERLPNPTRNPNECAALIEGFSDRMGEVSRIPLSAVGGVVGVVGDDDEEEKVDDVFATQSMLTESASAFSMFRTNNHSSTALMTTMAPAFDIDVDDDGDDDAVAGAGAVAEYLEDNYNYQCQLVIAKLLLENLQLASECNLAHLLLGFPTSDAVIADYRSTDRHPLLEQLMKLARLPHFASNYSELAQLCFEVFFRLAVSRFTSKYFFEFVQLQEDLFFFNLLHRHVTSAAIDARTLTSVLLQRAWLSQSVAVQLHIAESNDLKEQAVRQLDFPALLSFLDQAAAAVPPDPRVLPSLVVGRRMQSFQDPATSQYDVDALFHHLSQTVQIEKVEELCQIALDWNEVNAMLYAFDKAVNGWCQVVEVCVYDVYEGDTEQHDAGLLDLLAQLLQRMSAQGPTVTRVWRVVAEKLATAALTLMAKLREHAGATTPDGRRGHSAQSRAIFTGAVAAILHQEWSAPRAYLYALLQSFVQYTCAPDQIIAFLQTEYVPLLQCVCDDATQGAAVKVRPLAFVCLNTLLSLSPDMHGACLAHMEGPVERLVAEVRDSDTQLREAVRTDRGWDALTRIRIHEGIMSLLVTVAGSRKGADMLVKLRVLEHLAAGQVLVNKPDRLGDYPHGGDDDDDEFSAMVSPLERYLRLLVPALRLLVAMLASSREHAQEQGVRLLLRLREAVLKESAQSARGVTALKLFTAALVFIRSSDKLLALSGDLLKLLDTSKRRLLSGTSGRGLSSAAAAATAMMDVEGGDDDDDDVGDRDDHVRYSSLERTSVLEDEQETCRNVVAVLRRLCADTPANVFGDKADLTMLLDVEERVFERARLALQRQLKAVDVYLGIDSHKLAVSADVLGQCHIKLPSSHHGDRKAFVLAKLSERLTVTGKQISLNMFVLECTLDMVYHVQRARAPRPHPVSGLSERVAKVGELVKQITRFNAYVRDNASLVVSQIDVEFLENLIQQKYDDLL